MPPLKSAEGFLVRAAIVAAVLGAAALLVRGASVMPVGSLVPHDEVVAASPLAAPAATDAPASPPVAPTSAPARVPAPFLLGLSDSDLTRAAASAFPRTVNGVTVSDPVVRIGTTGVRLTASGKVLFGSAQFAMLATPAVSDGRIAVRVDSATLAGVGLPGSSRGSIAATVDGMVATLVPPDVHVTGVALSNGSLVVRGVARP